jgi:hypothetical protein
MEQRVVQLDPHIEAIGRYLGRTFPAACVDRYEDTSRSIVGFRFIGGSHGNVEFARALLKTFPRDENGVALELHLRHVGSEINATPLSHRLVFTLDGPRREPA